MKQDITVIMNTYHERPEWLKAAIERVLPQVGRVIISLCKGDSNEEMIEKLIIEHLSLDMCILPPLEQLGKCPEQSFRQINKAMAQVKTKYVSWTSSDDLMWEHKYAFELAEMREHPHLKVVYGCYAFTDENLQNPKHQPLPPYSLEAHKKGNIVTDLALFHTDLWHEFGGFDCERFRNYSFWDFWLKIAEKYGESAFSRLNTTTWFYRQDAEGMHMKRKKSPEQQAEAARDRAAMLKSHGIEP